jgi:homopolymeric O-antigen transport system permease protein
MVPQYDRAWQDIYEGTTDLRRWGRMGWMEVRRRYRRTLIGPFWMTLSQAIMVSAMGFIWAQLFHMDLAVYLPYLSAGIIVWSLISAFVTEGCVVFTSAQNLITTIRLPFFLLAISLVWRNIIVMFHNLVVFVAIALIWRVPLDWATLLFVPGLIIISLNGVWAATLLGLTCTRFRDINQLVIGLLQVMSLVTPIYWSRSLLNGREAIVNVVDFNPIYHLIEILRAPMLGVAPSVLNYAVAIGTALAGWGITFMLFSRFRRRIPYWI